MTINGQTTPMRKEGIVLKEDVQKCSVWCGHFPCEIATLAKIANDYILNDESSEFNELDNDELIDIIKYIHRVNYCINDPKRHKIFEKFGKREELENFSRHLDNIMTKIKEYDTPKDAINVISHAVAMIGGCAEFLLGKDWSELTDKCMPEECPNALDPVVVPTGYKIPGKIKGYVDIDDAAEILSNEFDALIKDHPHLSYDTGFDCSNHLTDVILVAGSIDIIALGINALQDVTREAASVDTIIDEVTVRAAIMDMCLRVMSGMGAHNTEVCKELMMCRGMLAAHYRHFLKAAETHDMELVQTAASDFLWFMFAIHTNLDEMYEKLDMENPIPIENHMFETFFLRLVSSAIGNDQTLEQVIDKGDTTAEPSSTQPRYGDFHLDENWITDPEKMDIEEIAVTLLNTRRQIDLLKVVDDHMFFGTAYTILINLYNVLGNIDYSKNDVETVAALAYINMIVLNHLFVFRSIFGAAEELSTDKLKGAIESMNYNQKQLLFQICDQITKLYGGYTGELEEYFKNNA